MARAPRPELGALRAIGSGSIRLSGEPCSSSSAASRAGSAAELDLPRLEPPAQRRDSTAQPERGSLIARTALSTTRLAQRSGSVQRSRLSVSLPITQSSVGRPIAARPGRRLAVGADAAVRSQLQIRAARSRRGRARRAIRRGIGAGRARRPGPGSTASMTTSTRAPRPAAPTRSIPTAARARPREEAVDHAGVDQRRELRGVDRRRPEGDPLHLAREAPERRPLPGLEAVGAETGDDRRVRRATRGPAPTAGRAARPGSDRERTPSSAAAENSARGGSIPALLRARPKLRYLLARTPADERFGRDGAQCRRGRGDRRSATAGRATRSKAGPSSRRARALATTPGRALPASAGRCARTAGSPPASGHRPDTAGAGPPRSGRNAHLVPRSAPTRRRSSSARTPGSRPASGRDHGLVQHLGHREDRRHEPDSRPMASRSSPPPIAARGRAPAAPPGSGRNR